MSRWTVCMSRSSSMHQKTYCKQRYGLKQTYCARISPSNRAVYTIQPTWTLQSTLVASILGDGIVSGVHAIIHTRFCDSKSHWKGLTVGKVFATCARCHNTSAIELWKSGTNRCLFLLCSICTSIIVSKCTTVFSYLF